MGVIDLDRLTSDVNDHRSLFPQLSERFDKVSGIGVESSFKRLNPKHQLSTWRTSGHFTKPSTYIGLHLSNKEV